MADELLDTRGRTHGDYRTNAEIAQEIKSVFRKQECWNSLEPVQKESLEMIALKLSRILSGHSQFKDHWDDISGYAALVSKYSCK